MTDLKILIIPCSVIGISEPCYMQTWIALWLSMSDLFHIGYPGKSCYLPLINYAGHTLELIVFNVLQCLVPSFWEVPVAVETISVISG